MANHKSALKRIRSSETKRIKNRYQAKTTRTYIKRLRNTTDKKEAEELLKTVCSMLDKLAKRNAIPVATRISMNNGIKEVPSSNSGRSRFNGNSGLSI